MAYLSTKKGKIILILLVFALGFFLRAYHFSDWLHFELDQSRDAKVIDLAIQEGPENLPLLGPKAAGSFLRLGPIFYYFKYLSALTFGNTPSGIAIIIMIFGVLAIPAFYFLVRRYFSFWISIGLLLLFSTSLFLIMYSRFSWNPNSMVLFTILTVYCLLRAVDAEEKRKGVWLLGASFFLAIVTQMHFLAFVSIPLIAAAFLILKRPRIKIAYWIGAVLILLFLNSPVIINEIKTGGDNSKELIEMISGKSSKDSEKTLVEKAFKNYMEHSAAHFLMLSSQNTELPKLEKFDIKCGQECRDKLPLGAAAVLIFSFGIFLLVKNLIYEKDVKKKDFLIIVFLWFGAAFGLFVPLAFDISPRFWLLTSALPFIFLGFIIEFISEYRFKKIAAVFAISVIFILAASNLYETGKRFSEMKKAAYETVKVSQDRILKEGHRVTLEQQYMIIDYIEGFYEKNNYPIYLNSDPFYRRSLLFHLDQRSIPRDDLRNASNSHKVYQNGNYFLVYPTDSNLEKDIAKYEESYQVVGKKQFGTLMVIQMEPKPDAINAIEQEFEEKGKPKSAPGVPVRYRWEEIFGEEEIEE